MEWLQITELLKNKLKVINKIFYHLGSLFILNILPFFLLSQNVNLKFQNKVGDFPLILDSVKYVNELNQDFTISKFKYYISNISFENTNGTQTAPSTSFLIDQEDSLSHSINSISIPSGIYSSIEFILGVDSLHNVSGSQTGDLDVVNAMFWTWNSGYIFMKLEGNSSFSNSPGHFFEYHIGGFKQPFNAIRKIKLTLDQPIEVSKHKLTDILINVNVLEILQNPNSIDFTKTSSILEPHQINKISDNYVDIFSIKNIR